MSSSAETAAQQAAAALGFQSREDLKKQKALEEARKSGLIPAEKDEEGKDINPHIPQYIAKAPWYLSQNATPSLKHQRFKQEEKSNIDNWYQRGYLEGKPVKFRKGACENCGALSHAKQDCTERPRKRGAALTGSDMKSDEIIPECAIDLGFEGKRDRWGGYDPDTYKLVISDYEEADAARRMQRASDLKEMIKGAKTETKKQKLLSKLAQLDETFDEDDESGMAKNQVDASERTEGTSDTESEGLNSDDEDARIRDFDQQNAPIGTKDERTRTTTRNLRIREDTAKYLFNLDVESAFYDPKTRSMRDDPLKDLRSSDDREDAYAGDNAVRNTGFAPLVQQMQVYAWEAYKHGASVNCQAQPTQLEKLHQQHLEKKKELVNEKRDELLEKYGGREHLEAPEEKLLAQTEHYAEYGVDGRPIERKIRSVVLSKYAEDVHPGSHSSVWGSFWDSTESRWGFACCKQMEYFGECMGI